MAGLKLVPVDEGTPPFEVQGDRATVGRTAGVDHIVNDPSVSRQHAVFERQATAWTVTDQGSANGTFLDGQRITTAEVRDGQEIRFGAKAFRVHVDWAEMPTAFLPVSVPAPPPPIPPRPIPPRPVPPRPVASAPPLPPKPAPTVAAPPRPPIPPRPIPPRPVPPPPPQATRPPLAEELGLPPTIPPQRGPLVAPPRPPSPPARPTGARHGAPAEAGLWQERTLLVLIKEARLPDRCVKCGEPAVVRLNRKLSWHNPLLYFLIPLGLLVYAIVATVVSKRAQVEIPLCEAHRKRRTVLTGIGTTLFLLGVLGFVAAIVAEPHAVLSLIGLVFFVAGIVVALVVGHSLPLPARIDDQFVWLKGVDESLRAGLPAWPGPTAALVGLASSGGLPAGPPLADTGPSGMAQAAFVSGCLSIFLCPAPIAIVLGILGILDVRRVPGRAGMGRSVFGLVAGVVGSLFLGVASLSYLNESRRTSSYLPAPRLSPPALPRPIVPTPGSVVILSKDGALRIAAPPGWRSESELNKNAQVQACDPPQEVCVMVLELDKKTAGDVTLAQFSRYTRGQILKRLTNSSESAGLSLQVAGYPAWQYELRGHADRFDLVYLHTSIETRGHFYQVLGWTSSKLFPQERAVISGITATFQPAVGR